LRSRNRLSRGPTTLNLVAVGTLRDPGAAGGGPELDPDELRLRYRQGSLYTYVAPLITAGMGGIQDESIALEGVRRGAAALADLEIAAVLEESLA
jgi:hypothetical protein